MDTFSRLIHYIIWGVVFVIFVIFIFRSFKAGRDERKIINDAVHVSGEIVSMRPGTPAANGVVSVSFKYKYPIHSGDFVVKDDELVTIKTMDLYNYKEGGGVPVIYAKKDPYKSMLNIPDPLKK